LLEHRTGSSGQGIAVKNDRIHGKAVTSIEALGVVVGGKAVTDPLLGGRSGVYAVLAAACAT
jgi:hypothetical protein